MMIYLLIIAINVSPLVNRANKLYAKEEYEEAYELYKKASILYPDNEKIKFNLSDCAYNLKRFRESADGFVRLSTHEDKDVRQKSVYNLGNTFMEVGQFKEAISAYKQALLLNPHDVRAKRNLEIAKMMQKKEEEQKDKEDEKEDEREQEQEEQQESTAQNQIREALQADQKETMKKALKKQAGGRRKEAGKW